MAIGVSVRAGPTRGRWSPSPAAPYCGQTAMESKWTIDRLRAHLAKGTGIELSESWFRALLKREGFRYRRPKYDLSHLQGPEAKAQADELLEGLKKRSSETSSSSSLWTKPL